MAIDIRPTVRRRIGRISTYVVFLVIVILLIIFADWKTIGQYFFNLNIAAKLWPGVLRSALNTIVYTLVSFSIGLVLATVLALMKMSFGPFKYFAVGFIEFFRGVPALLTIFAMGLAVPIAFQGAWIVKNFPLGTLGWGLVGLVLVTGAYTSEIIRAGIVAVPRGQTEAARSLGMSPMRTTVTVVLPQAFRIVIPPLTNELVTLLKDTSLLFIIGATRFTKELTMFGRDGVTTYASGTPLIVVAVLYLIITIPLTYLVSRLEKRMAVRQ